MARKRNQNKRYSNELRAISLIQFNDLPAAARAKARGQGEENYGKTLKDIDVSDLSSTQRLAISDVACIIDGDTSHFLSPTGDFAGAVVAMIRAKESL